MLRALTNAENWQTADQYNRALVSKVCAGSDRTHARTLARTHKLTHAPMRGQVFAVLSVTNYAALFFYAFIADSWTWFGL